MSDVAIRAFGPCVKCEGQDVKVSYHSAKPHCDQRCSLPPESCKYDVCTPRVEHLIVHWVEHLIVRCERCGYRWQEEVS